VVKMHADEVDTDPSLVRRLLAAQFPHWADLPIDPVEPRGTDTALYRLGKGMVVRLPRRARTVGAVAHSVSRPSSTAVYASTSPLPLVALAATSASLLADPTPLDPWLGVAAHA